MKKFLKMVIALLVVAALLGITQFYKESIESIEANTEEKIANLIIVPEKPEAAEGNFAAVALPESTGESYPWEAEFQEENYEVSMESYADGNKFLTWFDSDTGVRRRVLSQDKDGNIGDYYYYPTEQPGLTYEYYADGSYTELRRLDAEEGQIGQLIYQRSVAADGSTSEYHWNKDGCSTYYYYKHGNTEIELIGDETGKLIKYTNDGVIIEDPAILAEYTKNFGFRE